MPQVNPTCFHQSASSIASFKACPTRWRLAYREGLRLAQDTDSQRQGTNWHRLHEGYYAALKGEYFQDFGSTGEAMPETPEEWKAHALERVILLLNEAYKIRPTHKTEQEWALERMILWVSFNGYLWYFENDPIEVLASEIPFDLPVQVPKVGMNLPMTEVKRVGKIDHVIRWQNMVGTLERKSTSRSIAPDSDYWDKSKKDTQVSMYAAAFREIGGKLMTDLKITMPEDFGNTLYDVWHKPTIKPAMLTQKETVEFIQTGMYCEQQFNVNNYVQAAPLPNKVGVNGEEAEVEMGKKGFAIRETVEMYGARLLQDIYERPDFYYQRREIVRTDAELAKFAVEGYNIYQTMKVMDKTGNFYENESQCRATFPCSYIPICYGPGADAVCDGKTTPDGFRRIFVDLTVKGEPTDD